MNFDAAHRVLASHIFRMWPVMPPEYRRAYGNWLVLNKPHYFMYNGALMKVMQ